MASLLNVTVCGADGVLATGIPLCDLKKKRMKGIIFADPGVTFTAAEMASQAAFATAFALKCQADRGGRIYPLWNLVNFDDNTPEPSRASVGNLTTKQIITDDPIPQLSFAHSGGDLLHLKLNGLESGNFPCYLVDAGFVMRGNTLATGDLAPYSVYEIYNFPSKYLAGDAVNQYRLDVTLDSLQEYKYNTGFFVANNMIANYKGLNNVALSLFNQTTNVAKILLIADGGKNLFDYPNTRTALTTAGSLIATNDQTGASFAITSVAATDTVNKVFAVTLDSTAYGALTSGDKVTINLAKAMNLPANGIIGFESLGGVKVTKA